MVYIYQCIIHSLIYYTSIGPKTPTCFMLFAKAWLWTKPTFSYHTFGKTCNKFPNSFTMRYESCNTTGSNVGITGFAEQKNDSTYLNSPIQFIRECLASSDTFSTLLPTLLYCQYVKVTQIQFDQHPSGFTSMPYRTQMLKQFSQSFA